MEKEHLKVNTTILQNMSLINTMNLFELLKISPEKEVSSTKEDIYLWCYNPSMGFHVAKGRYAGHNRLFYDSVFKPAEHLGIGYDKFDRGYLKTFPQIKTLYFMPTNAREHYDFPMDIIFQKNFPHWNTLHLGHFDLKFKPNLPVRDTMLDSFESMLEKIRYSKERRLLSDYAKTLQTIIKINLNRKYIVAKVILKGNVLKILSSKEKYVITLPEYINSWSDIDEFAFQPIVTKEKSVNNSVSESVETTTRFGTYLWIYTPRYGISIKKGHYAQHAEKFEKLINDRRKKDFNRLSYDFYERGYLKVDPTHKVMYIMPTDSRGYMPENMKEIFKKEFPNWQIEQFDTQKINYRPGLKIKGVILDTIKARCNSIKKEYVYFGFALSPKRQVASLSLILKEMLASRYIAATVKIKGNNVQVIGSIEKYNIEVPTVFTEKITPKDFKVTPMAK